jgi:pyridoxamine 5'-phosphate oxidase
MTLTLTDNLALVNPGFEVPPSYPLLLLQKWLEIPNKIGICEPGALVLSSVDVASRPSSLIVLLEECDASGIVFATRQDSTKGQELQENPWAAGTL